MGTNYYLESDVCACCGRAKDRLHIGKSSAGWCFALNTHPDQGITDLDQWCAAWSADGSRIVDEYGEPVTPGEMYAHVTQRVGCGRMWSERELALNDAEPGPHYLVRHRVDGRHCLAHGEGTWDLMRGEFG